MGSFKWHSVQRWKCRSTTVPLKVYPCFYFHAWFFWKNYLPISYLWGFRLVEILRKKNGEIIRINTFEILTKSDFAIFAWCVSRNYAYCPFKSWNLPEVEFPVEPAPGHITGSYILKTFIWDNINHRTHDSFPNQSSINQPTNQPINQIINQSTIRPINPSFGQPTNLSINQPFYRSTYQSIVRPAD